MRYIRDKEGREVNFAILKDGFLEKLVEVKFADDTVSRSLMYYTEKLKPPKATQLVAGLRHSFGHNGRTCHDPNILLQLSPMGTLTGICFSATLSNFAPLSAPKGQ